MRIGVKARTRRILCIDWLCQYCWKQGTRRWLDKHACAGADLRKRLEAEQAKRPPGPFFFPVGHS